MSIIDMHHPETGNNGTSTEEAFDLVWAPRGWVRLEHAPLEEAMKKDDLVALAEERGIDVSDAKTKAEVAEKIKKDAANKDA